MQNILNFSMHASKTRLTAQEVLDRTRGVVIGRCGLDKVTRINPQIYPTSGASAGCFRTGLLQALAAAIQRRVFASLSDAGRKHCWVGVNRFLGANVRVLIAWGLHCCDDAWLHGGYTDVSMNV